jgi:hypothetical protein
VSTIEELLERKSSGWGLESREYGHSDPSRNVAPSIRKCWHLLLRQRWSLGQYGSLADSGHGIYFSFLASTDLSHQLVVTVSPDSQDSYYIDQRIR